MIRPEKDEPRLEYLLRVAVQYLKENGESTIDYDETTCDGLCLAEELECELDQLKEKQ